MDKTKTAAAYAENMQAFARVLENLFPQAGFALMVFDKNTDGDEQMRFISNCPTESLKAAMKVVIAQMEQRVIASKTSH
ncbi:hypothetical protein [Brucella pseudintermedia]|uniref:hypothetical protein n=1 Tax=Brucella pseudintermedia TaxID=370111 RepID=UPI00124F5765|nr:hypothetical protein [Brucella pseudintermedia]KAB2677824.1 hypothetical protein F9K78_21010 [Brucella pseudintermedia]